MNCLTLRERLLRVEQERVREARRKAIERAAHAALEAYESRFGSTHVKTRNNLTGPIDDEMIALREALGETQ